MVMAPVNAILWLNDWGRLCCSVVGQHEKDDVNKQWQVEGLCNVVL